MRRSVHLDHQQRPRSRRDARVGIAADHLDGGAVHELQRARGDGLGHDGRDRSRSRLDIAIGSAQGTFGLGQGGQLEGRFRDQGQGPFGADDQAREVVSDYALGRAHPRADALPGSGDCL